MCSSKRILLLSIPIGITVISIGTVILAYYCGVQSGSLAPLPFIPFISDLGNDKPASSVFTLGITLIAQLNLFLVIFAYCYVRDTYGTCKRANKASLVMGLVLVLGKLVVGAFQLTSVKDIHFFGAALYFIGSVMFAIFQSHIARVNVPQCPSLLYWFRLICTSLMSISLVVFMVFLVPVLTKHNRNGANIGQIAEWCFSISKTLFTLSFIYEFSGELPEVDIRFPNYSHTDVQSHLDTLTRDKFDSLRDTCV